MNPVRSSGSVIRPPFSRGVFLTLGIFCAAAVCSLGRAQTPAAGTITGRVLNPLTKEYVDHAEVRVVGTSLVAITADDGSYRLDGVPAGAANVAIDYAGYAPELAVVNVEPGASAIRDFELKPIAGGRRAADDVVKLSAFVVESEREGNSKSIMQQKTAPNMTNIASADSFGNIAEGNIGEFMKFLPGVTAVYNESSTVGIRIGGLDPTYAGITLDGARLPTTNSSQFNASSRQAETEQLSINNIESIEVNKTLRADMDADSPAGLVNLRSKNAFERKGRRISYVASMIANSYDLTFHKTQGPDDEGNRLKIRPSALFDYSDVFLDHRLGVQFTLSRTSAYTEQYWQTNNYDYGDVTRGPVLTQVSWKDGPKITERSSGSFNADFRATEFLVLKFRSQASYYRDDFSNRTDQFATTRANVAPSSTLTHWVVNATANATTNFNLGDARRDKMTNTVMYQPGFEYKRGRWVIDGNYGYSRSYNHYEDIRSGFFANVNAKLSRISWTADRPTGDSSAWTFTQTSGPSWFDLSNYNKPDVNTNNVGSTARDGTAKVFQGELNAKRSFVTAIPFTVKAGARSRMTVSDFHGGNQVWTYLGPNGVSTNAPLLAEPFIYNPEMGGNTFATPIPYPDRTGMYALYTQHPEYFAPDVYNNWNNLFLGRRNIKEQVDAGYAMVDARWRRLRASAGLRQERTRTNGLVYDPLSDRQVTAAGYTLNTVAGELYKYHNGIRSRRYGSYRNNFVSGGVKYDLTDQVSLSSSYSQSIRRPNLDNIAGLATINDTTQIITVPNPNLKPENSGKWYTGIEYYPRHGVIRASYFDMKIKNQLTARSNVTQADAGPDFQDPFYSTYTFQSYTNGAGTRHAKGLEFEVRESLSFLPSVLANTTVFSTYTRLINDTVLAGVVPHSASGGVSWFYRRFNIAAKCAWTSDQVSDVANNRRQKDRTIVDLDAAFKLRRDGAVSLFLAGRNIFNRPIEFYSVEPGRLYQVQRFGVQWTAGIKGTF